MTAVGLGPSFLTLAASVLFLQLASAMTRAWQGVLSHGATLITGLANVNVSACSPDADVWSVGMIIVYLLSTVDERHIPLFKGTGGSPVKQIESMVDILGYPRDIDGLMKRSSEVSYSTS